MNPPGPGTHQLLLLASARTILATNVTRDSTLSPNEFALCLRALLQPALALSPCEFAANLKITQFLLLYIYRAVYEVHMYIYMLGYR